MYNYEQVIEYYNNNSESLAERYAGLPSEKLHGKLIEILDTKGFQGNWLELGGGVGRDADFFSERYNEDCVLIEPAYDLLLRSVTFFAGKGYDADLSNEAKFIFKNNARTITAFNTALPELKGLSTNNQFGFINVNAVWQHINPEDRQEFADKLKQMLNNGGIISIKGRNLPTPEQEGIAWKTTADELRAQFSDLKELFVEEQPDHSKPGTDHTFISAIFQKPKI